MNSAPGRDPSESPGVAVHFREAFDALADLLGRHVELARIELKEDTRKVAVEVGEVATFTPLLLVGYTLLSVAAALFLRRFLAIDMAFLIVAVANLSVGAVGVTFAIKRLRAKHLMDDSRAEVDVTVAAIGTGHH